jgi:hypothetical protein
MRLLRFQGASISAQIGLCFKIGMLIAPNYGSFFSMEDGAEQTFAIVASNSRVESMIERG